MIGRALGGLFGRPSLVARAAHAPVALVPGRVPLHVVAVGTGVLRAGSLRRFVVGGLDDLVFVDVAGGVAATSTVTMTVSFRGQRVVVPLVAVAAPSPSPVVVVAPLSPLAPLVGDPAVAVAVPAFALPLPDLQESR